MRAFTLAGTVKPMRSITVFTAAWYPGNKPLRQALDEVRGRLEEKNVALTVVDVDEDLAKAEAQKVVSVPTAILYKDGEEKRRLTGAIGMPEVLGLAGMKSRARKLP